MNTATTGFPRRALIIAAAGVIAAFAAQPAAIAAPSPAAVATAANPANPAAQIEALDAALLSAMKAGKSETFAARMARLQPILDQALDIPAILAASIGPRWSTLTSAEQSALLDTFRRYTVANYAANFDSYDNQTFQIAPNYRVIDANRVVVQTTLVNPNGNEHKIDYVMHRTSQGWRVVDVLADGTISRVAVQRSDFSAALNSGGAAALESRLAVVTASLGPVA